MSNSADIWMPLYIGDYLADTQHLSAEESGAYLHLLMHSWKNGPLPANVEVLRRIAKVEKDAWSNAWSTLQAFFKQCPDGAYVQERLERERAEWNAKKEKSSQKAQRAAEKRWKHAPSIARSTPQAMPEQCPSPSPSPINLPPNGGDLSHAREAREELPPSQQLPVVKPPEQRTKAETDSLDPVQVARGLAESLGVPLVGSTLHVVSEAVRLFAAELKVTPHAAGVVMYRAGMAAKERGETIKRFWFEDGKYRGAPPSGEPSVGVYRGENPAEQQAREAQRIAIERALEGADREAGVKAWQVVTGAVQREANAQSFTTWVKPLRAEGVKDGRLILRGPNESFSHVPQKFGLERFLPSGVIGVQMIFGEAVSA